MVTKNGSVGGGGGGGGATRWLITSDRKRHVYNCRRGGGSGIVASAVALVAAVAIAVASVINQTALCVVVRTHGMYGNDRQAWSGSGDKEEARRIFPEHYSRRLKSLRFASNLHFTPVPLPFAPYQAPEGCCWAQPHPSAHPSPTGRVYHFETN